MFTADITETGAARIVQMYREDLKSDVVQVGHHGNKGGSVEYYQLCDPDYAYWCCGGYAFTPPPNAMPQNIWLKENAEIFYAYEAAHTFWFGEKLSLENGISGSVDEDGSYSRVY